jgi:hypothetical protein
MNKALVIFVILSVFGYTCKNDFADKSISGTGHYLNNKIGNNKNPGTVKRPIKTISELNTCLQAKPGSIFFAGGQVFEGTLNLNNIIGVDSIPISVGSYGGGRAVINGGGKESIRIENCKNIRITNLDLKGSGQMMNGKNNGSKFLGNVWWSARGAIKFMQYETLTEWAKATGQETSNGKIIGLETDPVLNGPFITGITDPYQLGALTGYMLKPESPLKNRGVDVRSVSGFDPPSVDFFGNPLTNGSIPEPGIHEVK